MNYKHFKHFRNPFVSKMLIVQMNGIHPFSFQLTGSVQATYIVVCLFKMTYLWGNQVNRHKIHKNHSISIYHVPDIMGNLNFPHFAHFAATKCGKCAKFTLRGLQKSVFLAFCTFCLAKSPKGAKSIFREI